MFIGKHIETLSLVSQDSIQSVVYRCTQMTDLFSDSLQYNDIFDGGMFHDIKLLSTHTVSYCQIAMNKHLPD